MSIYSRKFSDQVTKAKDIQPTDMFVVGSYSHATPTVYDTKQVSTSTLFNALVQQTHTKINMSYNVGAGLSGDGSVGNPIELDMGWVSENYFDYRAWNFTQVGRPTDIKLPVEGSFFSIGMPMSNELLATGYVEWDDTLTLLKNTSNGQRGGAHYAYVASYTSGWSPIVSTDRVYNPPGLQVGEYVGYVHQSSDDVMLVEVYNQVGFSHYAIAQLNGTLIDTYHTLIKLPPNLLTALGAPDNGLAARKYYRTQNIQAVKDGSNYYIVSGRYGTPLLQLRVVHVNMSGVGTATGYTIVGGWTTTNAMGRVVVSDYIDIYSKPNATDQDDKDGLIITYPHGEHYRWWDNGRTVTVGKGKAGWYTSAINSYVVTGNPQSPGNELAHQLATYVDINFSERKCRATLSGRRTISYITESEYWVDQSNTLGWHLGSTALCRKVLNDGNLLGVMWVTQGHSASCVVWKYDGDENSRFVPWKVESDKTDYGYGLQPVMPTPVNAGGTAFVIGDYAHTWGSASSDSFTPAGAQGSRVKLTGAPTYEYRVPTEPPETTIKSFMGHAPTNQRKAIVDREVRPNVFVEGGVISTSYTPWHFDSASPHLDPSMFEGGYDLDDDLMSRKSFRISRGAVDQIKAILGAIAAPSDSTEMHSNRWAAFLPPPTSSRRIGMVSYSPVYVIENLTPPMNLRPITTRILVQVEFEDVDGSPTITSVSKYSSTDHQIVGSGTSNTIKGFDPAMAGVVTVVDDNVIRVVGADGMVDNGNVAGLWSCFGSMWGIDGALRDGRSYGPFNVAGYHSTLGLGTSSDVGPSFYGFKPMSGSTIAPSVQTYVMMGASPAINHSLVITSDIVVSLGSVKYSVPVGVYELSDVVPDPANKTFYLYVNIVNAIAELRITTTPLQCHRNLIYVGYARTDDHRVVEVYTPPVTLWSGASPSTIPAGASIPVSTMGLDNTSAEVTVWEGVSYMTDDTGEYGWSGEDAIGKY